MREALRNPAVRRILAAAAVSQVGDWAARQVVRSSPHVASNEPVTVSTSPPEKTLS